MGVTREVNVPLQNTYGRVVGILVIGLPGEAQPSSDPSPLVDLSRTASRDPGMSPFQLLEDAEYRYQLILEPDSNLPLVLEPTELFSPDSPDWRSGRLRPKLYTGTLPISVRSDQRELGRALLEVRSRKLDYLNQYRWMLDEIADSMAQLVMERFAPTEQIFNLDHDSDAVTLYERFALLKALFSGEVFEAAAHQVLSHPHRDWVEEPEFRRPSQPIPMRPHVARQLPQPGPRVPAVPGLPVATLPATLSVARTDETLDTPENRFVKFALLRWRDFVAEVERVLRKQNPTAPVRRGLWEVQSTLERLHELLGFQLFHMVGALTYLPAGSQVLQKRAGYRDIYRAFIQFESAAKLTWDGGQEVYGAGQRDVATLYEYWVFLQLVKVMERLTLKAFDRSSLLELRPDGMGVSWRRGKAHHLAGSITRLGRSMQIELWFNRSFGHRSGDRSSWSRPMRPDYSLLIKPEASYGEPDEVWIHFDAKYRVETVTHLFGADPMSEEEEAQLLDQEQTSEAKLVSKRADLLKMHAYRDAIRRSAGAYVIYPGSEKELLPMFHELLPGLGAFALRPTRDGTETGLDALYDFIDEVITHVATQTTQHERTRYWLRRAMSTDHEVPPQPAVQFLKRPPADTPVLLGYVKGSRHWQWIQQHRLYNLRADGRRGSVLPASRELAAELVVLYEPRSERIGIWQVEGSPVVISRAEMARLGYPQPNGTYFCLGLTEVPKELWPTNLAFAHIQEVLGRVGQGAPLGAPVATTWLELVR